MRLDSVGIIFIDIDKVKDLFWGFERMFWEPEKECKGKEV